MTSKPLTKKLLTSQQYQQPQAEAQIPAKPSMRPGGMAKPKFQIQKGYALDQSQTEQVLVNEDLQKIDQNNYRPQQTPPQQSTKPTMKVLRAVQPQQDPFGDSMEASQPSRVQPSQVTQNKPQFRPMSKKAEFQPQTQEDNDLPKGKSRERDQYSQQEEVKQLKPFNITATKNPKTQLQDNIEEQDPNIELRKFPEQSGRRTPYNMGPRQKLKQSIIQGQEEGTSIPVSLLLEQNQANNGPTMNLFQNKQKHSEETSQIQQEQLRTNMVRKNEVKQNPILVPQNRQSDIKLQDQDTRPIQLGEDEPPQHKRQLKAKVQQQLQEEEKQDQQPIPKQQPATKQQLQPKQQKLREEVLQMEEPKELPKQQPQPRKRDQNQYNLSDTQNNDEEVIVARQINIESLDQPQQTSQGRKEEQRIRCKDLQSMLTLEVEEYPNQFQLHPRSDYDIYINQIKSGIIKNSCDQAFDELTSQESQTEPMTFNDFANQAPEDFSRTFLLNDKESKNQYNYQTQRLQEFLDQAALVIEEILEYQEEDLFKKPQFQSIEPQFTQVLHIPPIVTKYLQCSNLSNVVEPYYHGQHLELYQGIRVTSKEIAWLNGSMIIVRSNNESQVPRLFFSPHTIQSITIQSSYIVCGTRDGSLVIWDVRDNQQSSKYTVKIDELFNQDIDNKYKNVYKNKRLIVRNYCYSSELLNNVLDSLESNQNEYHSGPVIQVKFNKQIKTVHELISMDVFGKILVWQLRELRQEESDRLYEESGTRTRVKLMLINQVLNKTPQRIRINFLIDEQTLLVYGGGGEVNKANKDGSKRVGPPKQYGESHGDGIIPSSVAITSKFFYVGYQDGSLKIFHKTHPIPIFSLQAHLEPIQYIIMISLKLPIEEGEFKKLDDMNRFITINNRSLARIWDLSQDTELPISEMDLNKNSLSIGQIVYASFSEITKHLNVFTQQKDLSIIQQSINIEKFCETNSRKVQEDNQMLIDSIIGDYKGNLKLY